MAAAEADCSGDYPWLFVKYALLDNPASQCGILLEQVATAATAAMDRGLATSDLPPAEVNAAAAAVAAAMIGMDDTAQLSVWLGSPGCHNPLHPAAAMPLQRKALCILLGIRWRSSLQDIVTAFQTRFAEFRWVHVTPFECVYSQRAVFSGM